jgi:hypothetical protein
MAKSYGPQSEPGLFVPTTNIWDVSQIYDIEVTSPEFKELLVRLYQNINNITLALNLKDSAYYDEVEFVNGQAFFPGAVSASASNETIFRQVFRKVINFGTLPNTATTSVPHGILITNTYSFTRIYATASDQTGMTYIPIPFASPTDADNIQLDVDATNVNITTGSDRTNYTLCYVVLEYIKTN